MITTGIILLGISMATVIVSAIPSMQISIFGAFNPAFISVYATIRQYLNYFLGAIIADLIIVLLFGSVIFLVVFGIVKLVRYFIPIA